MEENTNNSSSSSSGSSDSQSGQTSQPVVKPDVIQRPNTNVSIETHSANDANSRTKTEKD